MSLEFFCFLFKYIFKCIFLHMAFITMMSFVTVLHELATSSSVAASLFGHLPSRVVEMLWGSGLFPHLSTSVLLPRGTARACFLPTFSLATLLSVSIRTFSRRICV